MFQEKIVEKIKTHFIESRAVYGITWKNITVGQAADFNMEH
jgi:hypothetical protein